MIRYLLMRLLGYRRTYHAAGVSFSRPVWARYRRGKWRIVA